uniref:L-asparaginase N-terminal domain-containing protein n=1 Tax=Trieres chinensis TaxID=1514140 RepID=A0A7S2EFV4_TRICV|mmetsp:Transcript_21982/g.44466  ORF Transcript_21982/g.44466 Transcript_21982/m.44466 type:complete len:218 (+) Transcript_21982:38-691(+)
MASTGEESSGSVRHVAFFAMGGTIDKDYPRTTNGYAFEIDEPALTRVLSALPCLNITHNVKSVCRKDSTEIEDDDRIALVEEISNSLAQQVVVTHGTDTMIETARFVLRSGCAYDKKIAFTGAMKPERFKDSDADFNLGAAVAVTSICSKGSVIICMGGMVVSCQECFRCLETGNFLASSCGHTTCETAAMELAAKEATWQAYKMKTSGSLRSRMST